MADKRAGSVSYQRFPRVLVQADSHRGSVKVIAQIQFAALRNGSYPARETVSIVSRCFMLMYFLLPHCVPATCRSLAHTSINAELPSGKQPTTRVRRRISRLSRSIALYFRIFVQRSDGKSQYPPWRESICMIAYPGVLLSP